MSVRGSHTNGDYTQCSPPREAARHSAWDDWCSDGQKIWCKALVMDKRWVDRCHCGQNVPVWASGLDWNFLCLLFKHRSKTPTRLREMATLFWEMSAQLTANCGIRSILMAIIEALFDLHFLISRKGSCSEFSAARQVVISIYQKCVQNINNH